MRKGEKGSFVKDGGGDTLSGTYEKGRRISGRVDSWKIEKSAVDVKMGV